MPVRVFPDLETLPYDSFSAHPDITSARLRTLAELPRARRGVWVVAIDTLLQRLAPRSYIEAHSLQVHVGETLDLEALRERLALAGYAAVTQVAAHGEFAVRGSLLDVFPMGSDSPYRIDLLDRDVDSIRYFDPDTQRSGDKLERIHLLPARETPLSPDAVREFRRRYRLRFPGDLTEHAVYRDVSAGRAPGGLEFYLPLFFERTSHLFEYLPPSERADRHAGGDLACGEALVRHRGAARPARARSIPSDSRSGGDLSRLRGIARRARGVAQGRASILRVAARKTPEPVRNFSSSSPAVVRIDPRAEQPAAELEAHLAALGRPRAARGRIRGTARAAARLAARPRDQAQDLRELRGVHGRAMRASGSRCRPRRRAFASCRPRSKS